MTKLMSVLLTIVALCIVVNGCKPVPPSSSTVEPPTPEPTVELECPPIDFSTAAELQDSLESYRAIYDVQMIDETGVVVNQFSMSIARVKSEEAMEATMLGGEETNQDDSQGFIMILIGDYLYLRVPDEDWTVVQGLVAQEMFESQTQVLDPTLVERLDEATCFQTEEMVNEISAYHYRYDNVDVAGLPTLDDFPSDAEVSEAAVEAWVAVEGEFLVRYTLNIAVDYNSRLMTLSIDYRLSDINTPIEITAPEGVMEQTFPDDIPLLDDAVVMMESPEVMTYVTAREPDAVLDFYRDEMDKAGWLNDPANTGTQQGVKFIGYLRENTQVTIGVIVQEGQTTVTIIVEPAVTP